MACAARRSPATVSTASPRRHRLSCAGDLQQTSENSLETEAARTASRVAAARNETALASRRRGRPRPQSALTRRLTMAAVDPRKERLTIVDLALTALALGSGVTDVATFLTLGAVFTSAMTGNTALLGIAISHGDILAGAHSVSALLGFTFGAALATAIVAMGTGTARSLSAIRA